ncbi:MAG: helix-turn-helix transcriptional regulator [Christensenellaceae bacterium]|jgi:PadR family transcriptional regulator PadR|nr:helix-turn-helix transcriptional regulator [Christensenellaceae bacterium]
MESPSIELVRGHADTIIMNILMESDRYGYEIMSIISTRSHDRYCIKQPTLYNALKRLEKLGFVESYYGEESNGGRRRYYALTEKGRNTLTTDQKQWEYSRTILDTLLSDRGVDLATAEAPYDRNLLKPATKRTRNRTFKDRIPSAYDLEEEDEFGNPVESKTTVETAIVEKPAQDAIDANIINPITVDVVPEMPISPIVEPISPIVEPISPTLTEQITVTITTNIEQIDTSQQSAITSETVATETLYSVDIHTKAEDASISTTSISTVTTQNTSNQISDTTSSSNLISTSNSATTSEQIRTSETAEAQTLTHGAISTLNHDTTDTTAQTLINQTSSAVGPDTLVSSNQVLTNDVASTLASNTALASEQTLSSQSASILASDVLASSTQSLTNEGAGDMGSVTESTVTQTSQATNSEKIDTATDTLEVTSHVADKTSTQNGNVSTSNGNETVVTTEEINLEELQRQLAEIQAMLESAKKGNSHEYDIAAMQQANLELLEKINEAVTQIAANSQNNSRVVEEVRVVERDFSNHPLFRSEPKTQRGFSYSIQQSEINHYDALRKANAVTRLGLAADRDVSITMQTRQPQFVAPPPVAQPVVYVEPNYSASDNLGINVGLDKPNAYKSILGSLFKVDNSAYASEDEIAKLDAPRSENRRFRDLKQSLAEDGYKLRLYSKPDAVNYFSLNYILRNKILRDVALFLYMFVIIELLSIYLAVEFFEYSVTSLVTIAGFAFIIPLFALFVWKRNPVKRIKARFNFWSGMTYSLILFILIVAIITVITFFTIGFVNGGAYVPYVLSLNIPIATIIYYLLYRSKSYHIKG